MTPEEMAGAVKDAIGTLGGAFMLDPATRARGKALDAGSWGFYMVGRGAVLGDVDPSVVAAAFGFFPVETVTRGWERAHPKLAPADALVAYRDACWEWGRARLAAVDEADLTRLAALLDRVVEAADATGRPVFAGWRAVPAPDDPAAWVAHRGFQLREYRGGSHVIAVTAVGLTPLEAVLAGGGPGNAGFFGWPEPYADAAPLADRRAEAEALTDRLSAGGWAALDEAERDEAVRLLEVARAAALASLAAG